MTSEQPLELRKSRRLGDQINFTFTFFRENFSKLFKAVAVIAGPVILISAGLIGYAYLGSGIKQFIDGPNISEVLGTFLLGLFFIFVALLLMSGTVNEYVLLYLERGGSNFEVADVWRELKKDLGKLIVTAIGLIFLSAVAFMILIVIVGIGSAFFSSFSILLLGAACTYLFVPTTLIFTIRIIEPDLPLFESITRSFELVKGYWWLTYVIFLTTYVISYTIAVAIYIPFYAVIAILTEVSGAESIEDYGVMIAVASVIISLLGYFSWVLVILSSSLQYFNLVEKHEAVGLMSRIESIGLEREKEIDANHY